jgi:putative transposase
MPRKSRVDAAGALHHVIMRGIERSKIFRDDADRNDFLRRLSIILKDTKTVCYAWALIPNHIHLLLKTGKTPLSSVMRRLLTGYAVYYNRRYKRHGHLFQNRYKSILCQEDSYFLELVRYIHLNPLRADIVSDMNGLDHCSFAGHSVIIGKRTNDWQDTDGVLRLFGDTTSVTRRRYRSFIEKGIEEGRRTDLTGGGLVRSSGGWINVAAMRREHLC